MNPTNYLRIQTIVFFALFAGMILFSLITYFVIGKEWNDTFDISEPLFKVALSLVVVSFIVHQIIPKKILAEATNKKVLSEKLAIYSKANIVRWALVEGVVIFCLFVCFLTENRSLIYVIVGLLVFYFTLKPTKEKLFSELELTAEQRRECEKLL